MKTSINKQEYTFEVAPDESAITVIREKAKLTGTKLVCGAGVCGACTVLLDGVPVTSCLLPAHALEGRKVQTIEAHGPNNLHPVQRAFMAHDGLQCGFCTPGFINEGIAFYSQWREEHGTKIPTHDEIAAAFAGHLCRCGAYIGIYNAIQRACAGDFDNTTEIISPRVEAIEKVTGQAKYTVDIQYDDLLVGKILRSPHANAEIISIDTSAADAMDGVKAVITLLDHTRSVRYSGQEIAAVAAINEHVAREALSKIKVDYKVHPAVLSIAEALADNAPQVHPERKKNPPGAGEGSLPIPVSWQGNLRKPAFSLAGSKAGKAKKAIAHAKQSGQGTLVSGTWRTEAQIHTALEPHVCIAKWNGPHQLTVHTSTQGCHAVAKKIAEDFDLEDNNVQVICEHIGGGFGAKTSITPVTPTAIKLAHKAEAPVIVALDRLEEMAFGGYRPPADMELSLTAEKDGQNAALSAHAYSNSGVAVGSIVTIHMGSYNKLIRELVDYDVVTNLPIGKPFRGPGGPLACWSLEQAIDELAHKLNISPTDLRRKWDTHPQRLKLYDWADTIPAWRDRGPVASQTGRYRRGIGLAAASWTYFYHPDTHIKVTASEKGITASTASQDIGNGTRTVIARAVAEVFGISPLAVNIELGNSQLVRGPMAGGSRITNSVYYPAVEAATQVHTKLVETVTAQLGLQQVNIKEDGIHHAQGHLNWQEVFQKTAPVQSVTRRGTDARLDIMAMIPLGADDVALGKGVGTAVYLSEVEVDTLLGKTRVLKVWGGMAVGKIHVPELARSQCYGGVIQGIGYALYEERQIDPTTGTILSLGLEEYRIPGIGDTPEIEMHFLEEGFEFTKGKGIGLSELCTMPIAATIGNAVFHATGWRPYELPIRPDRVLKGVK